MTVYTKILTRPRARNLRLEEQLQAARSSAEVARTRESIAKRELELARTEIVEIREEIRLLKKRLDPNQGEQ